jgi:hypothetical protein
MPEQEVYLIWSAEHAGWWAPGGGYVARVSQAGRFSRHAALRLSTEAMTGTARRLGLLPEVPVRWADVQTMIARYRAVFPNTDEPWD